MQDRWEVGYKSRLIQFGGLFMNISSEIKEKLDEQVKDFLWDLKSKVSKSENFSDVEKRILSFMLIESLSNNQYLTIFQNIVK